MATRASVAVRKRLHSLDRGLDAKLDADAEALHQTRVATRRVREALPLFADAEATRPVTDLRRLVQHVTRALGGVREMDVALQLVDEFMTDRPDLEPAFNFVRSAMTAERAVRLQRMRQEVDVRRLRRASRNVAERLRNLNEGARPNDLLAARLAKRGSVLRRAVSDAGLLYAPERLHRVRIATKRLRYALELSHEMGDATSGRLVVALQKIQERLGLLHDLQTVAHHAREALGDPRLPDAVGRAAGSTLSLLDERIHAEHANYLADHESLLRIVDRTDQLCQRLRPQGTSRRRTAAARQA